MYIKIYVEICIYTTYELIYRAHFKQFMVRIKIYSKSFVWKEK